ncbi:MAG: Gfo/Idh/MocA family oxidoreductase [Ferruginibacter sp.]
MKRFALIGAAGYVAPRHMQAIKDTGNTLVAALDKHDSVGILDNYFPEADFFTEFERFDRHLDKLKRQGSGIDYLSVCSPNYLHDAHIRFGLRSGTDVICEKPIVLNPWNIDGLLALEKETGKRVFTILQLRLHPAIIALKKKVAELPAGQRCKVDLQYITARGHWYHSSWKGDMQKSGGIATNIGIHLFDMLLWLFGSVKNSNVIVHNAFEASGRLELEKADVYWHLSVDENALPDPVKQAGKQTFRVLMIDNELFDFSEGAAGLHTQSYTEILNGAGVSLSETRDVIELVHAVRNAK